MKLAIAMAWLLVSTLADAAPPTLSWWKLPADKFHCTRYAPGQRPGDKLVVYAPPGKPMIFTFAARASDRSQLGYRADGLPAGAKIDARAGRFEWSIPADAKGRSKITLIAETAGGVRITSDFELAIADPDLVAAWRIGMGGMQPDCAAYVIGYELEDVDGDGAKDLIYTTGDTSDDSANSGSRVAHVRRRVGDRFDTIERDIADGSLEVVTTPDGKTAVAVTKSCCCMAQLWIYRIRATGVDELGAAGGDACSGAVVPVALERDARGRVARIVPASGQAWRWNGSRFAAEAP